MSDSLQPHELQYTRPPCPSPTPRVHPNSCPSSQWCHPAISSSVIPFLQPTILPSIGVFSNESAVHIKWLKYWSFSISPSNEYSGLISFRDGLVGSPCSPRDSQECSAASQFESINSSVLSLLYGPALTSVHDYWKNHTFDYTDLRHIALQIHINLF